MSTYSPPGTGGGYNPYENHPMMPSTGHGIPHEQRRPTPPGSEDGAELEEYVVRVRAQPVAPVDEDGQVTTHRALTANQASPISSGAYPRLLLLTWSFCFLGDNDYSRR